MQIDKMYEHIETIDSFILKQQLASEFSPQTNYDYVDEKELVQNQTCMSYLNSEMLAKQINKFLADNKIPDSYFHKKLFNEAPWDLSKTLDWLHLNETIKEKLFIMRQFLRDGKKISNFIESYLQQNKSNGIRKIIVNEYVHLNENFTDQIYTFIEEQNITIDLFAHALCGISGQQLQCLFEKAQALLLNQNQNNEANGISNLDDKNLTKIAFWINRQSNAERKEMFEELKEIYKPPTVAAAEAEAQPIKPVEAVQKRGRKLKPKVKREKTPVQRKNSDSLLLAYYRTNQYPSNELYKIIADKCGLTEDTVQRFYKNRRLHYPFYVITIQQYCQLIDYFYNVNDKPTSDEIENLAKKCSIDFTYTQKWFIRQRQNEFELNFILKEKSKPMAEDLNSVSKLPKTTKDNNNNNNNFSVTQLIELEKAFKEAPIPTENRLEQLSERLDLSMDQLFNWFKAKRTINDDSATTSSVTSASESEEFDDKRSKTKNTFQIEYEYDE